jgi:hypothetical protein
MDRAQGYQIIITAFAERAYFEVLNYVFDYHSFEKANKITLELLEYPQALKDFPLLGKIEPNLIGASKEYRFLLFERTKKTTVKIIYFVDDVDKKIYLTDFFPCEMSDKKIKKRIE